MKIFRYYKAEHGLQVLNNLEIRSSIPNALNDPFELSPNIDTAQFDKQQVEAMLRQDHFIQSAYCEEGKKHGLTRKQFKRFYLKDVSRRAAEALPRVLKNVERVRTNFSDKFSKYWRLICTSMVHDSTLMWSHYADNHTGLVLAFDIAYPPFSQIGDDCWLSVTYSDQKPDYLYSHKQSDFLKQMFEVAAAKASQWLYEQEVRIVVAETALRDGRFLPLSAKSVAAVYCGCRISNSDKEEVRKILTVPHFKHVELWSAELDHYEYTMKFRSLSR